MTTVAAPATSGATAVTVMLPGVAGEAVLAATAGWLREHTDAPPSAPPSRPPSDQAANA